MASPGTGAKRIPNRKIVEKNFPELLKEAIASRCLVVRKPEVVPFSFSRTSKRTFSPAGSPRAQRAWAAQKKTSGTVSFKAFFRGSMAPGFLNEARLEQAAIRTSTFLSSRALLRKL